MDRAVFKKEVEKRLKKLNRDQQTQFTWRCAVRALPFLGSKGHFDFWPEKDRQKHLYAIFYALDVDAAAYDAAADDAYAAAYAAAEAAAYTAAAYAATTYDADTAAYAAARNNIDLTTIILNDLNSIGRGEASVSEKGVNIYGEVWHHFQKALAAAGCAYWGRLYEKILNNGFALDREALERRMNVPEEIRSRGAAAVAGYLEALEKKGAARLNEARIIILGDKGAGKTCIARRLIDPAAPMTTDDESTAGVNITLWHLEEDDINVRIWDFAGHTVTHAVHQFFLSERCLYLMVYDGRTEERNRLDYWLDHMKNHGGDSQAIILVNKRDQHSVEIPVNRLKEEYPIAGIHSFSIKDDIKQLAAFRKKVAAYIKDNPSWEKQKIPLSYYHVKKVLEKLFAHEKGEKGREHITKDAFNEIAEKHEEENVTGLLKSLHSLGISLWYEDMSEFNTLVLNPEWISDGVYKIINWANEAGKHGLSLRDFVSVFREEAARYPQDKHPFLFQLMKRYELAYETKNGKSLIIPHLLKEDRPATLPNFPIGASLMLRYKAEQPLPPHTISRFIVRHNTEIKSNLVWRYGVVLKGSRETTALVREEDRTISVSVKGPDKTAYISQLRETLNDIFNSYKSEKPELEYRIERFGQIPDEVEKKYPLWLADRKIMNHYQIEAPYLDDTTGQNIPIPPIIQTYNITAENIITGGSGHTFIKNTFNFRECNIGLQGNLNELAQLLSEGGHTTEAKAVGSVSKALEQAEDSKSKEEVKKKGVANRLRRLLEELESKDSKFNKAVRGVRNGISIAQDIAGGYNKIAEWVGLPQVPKPFLK